MLKKIYLYDKNYNLIIFIIIYYKIIIMIKTSKKNNILNIEKYMTQIDLVDYYITKNIIKIVKNKKEFEFIKSNDFLLSISNKNNKNALMILLESNKFKIIQELIDNNYNLLSYKNIYENNLFKLLLAYDYFYEYIQILIIKLDREFVLKILTEMNNTEVNFIDNLLFLININQNCYVDNKCKNLIDKLIQIIKNIYLLDNEKITQIITKLCKIIYDSELLINIFKLIDINNFDIIPDSNMLICLDYLILNESYDALIYLLDKINYVQFINLDNNLFFKLWESSKLDLKSKSELILIILRKSNISKFKNNKNQNIFFKLLEEYKIEPKILVDFFNIIDIYEQDINGISILDLIKKKYANTELIYIKKYTSKQINYNDIYKKICFKIKLNKKLLKSDIGIFNSNIIHNMLYTIILLKTNHDILLIPNYIQSNEYYKEQQKLIDMSNNEKNIIIYLKSYFNNFNMWLPHLILWKNKYNYWIDPNLIIWLLANKTKSKFIYIKLSVYLLDNNTRHSNAIIIDNVNKIVERFEPYGEMFFNNSNDINIMIQTNIANQLGYEFKFIQPYPGFQSRSDEFGKYNKTYGDPMGFCLAWSFLYLNIKLELFKINSNINPIDFINWYVINKFFSDFNIDKNKNKTNKYILFIRYYARYLDDEKNKLIKNYGLDPSLSYQADYDTNYNNTIIKNINDDLKKYCKII